MPDKIRVTVVLEYVPDPQFYPDPDLHAMAKLDETENNFRQYPEAYEGTDILSVTYEGIPA